MPLIFIFAIIATVSTAGILCLFAYRLQWIKKIRISFPETGEYLLDSFLRSGFGNEKIEKYASRCWDVSQDVAVRCVAYVKSHSFTLKAKDRLDRFLGKKTVTPDRETSSVFLKSIAEHKRKMHEEASEAESSPPPAEK